jgi:protein phosphatase
VSHIEASARTDRGHVRESNEDTGLARPDRGLFVVADGMGGHAAGEVASALAVDTVARRLAGDGEAPDAGGGGGPYAAEDDGAEHPGRVEGPSASAVDTAPAAALPGEGSGLEEVRGAVAEAVRDANRRILRDAEREPARRGMGTTLTLLFFPSPDRWVAGHVGDSRAYRFRDGELERLTADHTVAPGSSTLTRALGTGRSVEVDVLDGGVEPGDVFLLCSDGLTDMLDDAGLAAILAEALPGEGADVDDAARALVEGALERGGRDNVTVVLSRIGRA